MDWTLAQVRLAGALSSAKTACLPFTDVPIFLFVLSRPQYLPESFEQLAYDYGLRKLVDKYSFPKARGGQSLLAANVL